MVYPGTLLGLVARNQDHKSHTNFRVENLAHTKTSCDLEPTTRRVAGRCREGKVCRRPFREGCCGNNERSVGEIRLRPWVCSVISQPPSRLPFRLCSSASEYGRRMDTSGMIERRGSHPDDDVTEASRSTLSSARQNSVCWRETPQSTSGVSEMSHEVSHEKLKRCTRYSPIYTMYRQQSRPTHLNPKRESQVSVGR